jgi:hypothetical protein
MKKATHGQLRRYAFDRSLSGGNVSLIGWLAAGSLLIALTATAFIMATGLAPDAAEGREPQALGFAEAFRQSLMRSLDPGTVAGDAGWGYRALMLLVTLGGIFIVSLLIGVLSSGPQGKLEELRKGRSSVVGEGHTLEVFGELFRAEGSEIYLKPARATTSRRGAGSTSTRSSSPPAAATRPSATGRSATPRTPNAPTA